MRYLLFALLLTGIVNGQMGYPRVRRTGPKTNAAPPDGKIPNPTFEGVLKMLTSKEILLQMQSDQTLEIRRDRKTKWFDGDKEIKADSIAVGTPLAVDVRQDLDAKPIAVKVVANPPPPKSAVKTP